MDMLKTFLKNSVGQTAPRWMLVIARVYVGSLWIQTGWNKIGRGAGGLAYKQNMVDFINHQLDSTYTFYKAFLKSVALPNAPLFTLLVSWGEFLLGIFLFLGILTRFGAGVGMFLSLNFALLQARAIWLPGLDAALLWIQLVLLLTAAGRSLGVDYFLHKNFPSFKLS